MISRRSIAIAFALVGIPVTYATAQVRPLNDVSDGTSIQRASHVMHDPAVQIGHYGTVWGAHCLDGCTYRRPMFPPCPNPCRTTLLGDLVLHTRHALEKTFHCVFGPCGLCGCLSCHGECCPDAAYGHYHEGGDYSEPEVIQQGQPVPADDDNPFKDDPLPTGSGTKSSMRSILPQATQSPVRGPVRHVTHLEQAPRPTRARATATARPLPTSVDRWTPRAIQAQRLWKTQRTVPAGSSPVLRFRDH